MAVEFLTLSLPEASYLYIGLALQSMMMDAMKVLPITIVLVNVLRLLSDIPHRPSWAGFLPVIKYGAASLVILALFWPVSLNIPGLSSTAIGPEQVQSYAAVTESAGGFTSAGDTGIVPSLLGTANVPRGTAMALRGVMSTTLKAAQAIHPGSARPFSRLLPTEWLTNLALPADLVSAVRDFTHSCYLPAKAALFATGSPGRPTEADLLPWDGILGSYLAPIEVVVGLSNSHVNFLGAGVLGIRGKVSCQLYAAALSTAAYQFVSTSEIPGGGATLGTVFTNELSLSPLQVGRMLVLREIAKASGPDIPAPSATASYAATKTIALAGKVTSGFLSRGPQGAGAAAINGVSQMVDRIGNWIGSAVFAVMWAPYILGMFNMVLLALMPVVVLYSLNTRSQFVPLLTYFALLAGTTGTPLWWALVDLAANSVKPASGGFWDIIQDPAAFTSANLLSIGITVMGVFTVAAGMFTALTWGAVSSGRVLVSTIKGR